MERLNKLINDAKYKQYLAKIKQRERERIFCRHNWSHFINVGRIAYMLMLEQNLKDKLINVWKLQEDSNVQEIIYTAAILHDIGRWKEYDTGQDHAQVSADLAEGLLIDHGFVDLEKRIILRAIREHRGESNGNKSLLGNLISRADNLSRDCHACLVRHKCKSIKNSIIEY